MWLLMVAMAAREALTASTAWWIRSCCSSECSAKFIITWFRLWHCWWMESEDWRISCSITFRCICVAMTAFMTRPGSP